ncbi:hypothetical protein J2Z48_002945 [Croceifilum oryzae]|uniref:Uncharacterized protein n=1 Tax=Croceifilum oryzae TaxID=1553429 RepID=A0AAJ1TQN8_9BACL|nr:hypothetical protein [Croceifilum oryzae]MDQ0418741.1 hypothetical protein [Croceifilum oryzae]
MDTTFTLDKNNKLVVITFPEGAVLGNASSYEVTHWRNGEVCYDHTRGTAARFDSITQVIDFAIYFNNTFRGDNEMEYKTYDGWMASSHDLQEYLKVGDLVDEKMEDHFTDILPPAFMSSFIIQMGEPYSWVSGENTYSTLKWTLNGWMYCGHCHIGKTEEPS